MSDCDSEKGNLSDFRIVKELCKKVIMEIRYYFLRNNFEDDFLACCSSSSCAKL